MVVADRNDERTVQYARETVRGDLPAEFQWLQFLTRSHLVQFAVELKGALERMGTSGDDSEVLDLLDAWKATAALDAEPEVAEEVLRPREDSDYVEWSTKR